MSPANLRINAHLWVLSDYEDVRSKRWREYYPVDDEVNRCDGLLRMNLRRDGGGYDKLEIIGPGELLGPVPNCSSVLQSTYRFVPFIKFYHLQNNLHILYEAELRGLGLSPESSTSVLS